LNSSFFSQRRLSNILAGYKMVIKNHHFLLLGNLIDRPDKVQPVSSVTKNNQVINHRIFTMLYWY